MDSVVELVRLAGVVDEEAAAHSSSSDRMRDRGLLVLLNNSRQDRVDRLVKVSSSRLKVDEVGTGDSHALLNLRRLPQPSHKLPNAD